MHLHRLPKAHVTIRANGQTLQEHLTERIPHDALTATCFIESTNDSEFSVNMTLKRGFKYETDALVCYVNLDGKNVTNLIQYLRPVGKAGIHMEIREARSEPDSAGQYTSRTFKFAALETTDNNPTASDKKQVEHLGEIKVCLHRTRVKQPSHAAQTQRLLSTDDGPIAEKALKGRALSSRTKLGEAQARSSGKPFVELDFPWGKDPIATYIFKYRSRKDLQTEGIIARTPSPVPLEDRDLDDLEPVEARELIRRMRDRDEAAANIKREGLIKTEKSCKRRHPESGDDEEDEAGRIETDNNGKRHCLEIISDNEDEEEGEITLTSVTSKRDRVMQSMADQEVVDLSDD